MATFVRGYYARNVHRHNRRIVGASTATSPGKVTWTVTAADAVSLRGLPAIGRNVRGAVAGSVPGSNLT
jgi:hypothetical protein